MQGAINAVGSKVELTFKRQVELLCCCDNKQLSA
jgi:hypothetical protein